MTALNTTNFTTWANGLGPIDWQTFATDLGVNWLAGWSSRFILSARWTTALNAIAPDDRNQFIGNCTKAANALLAGLPLAVAGTYLDSAPTMSTISTIQSGSKLEYLYINIPGPGLVPVTAELITWTIILNCQA